MPADVVGQLPQAGKDLLPHFLVVDGHTVVLFHHDHHLQNIDGVNAQIAAHQPGVRVEIFRLHILQIQQGNQFALQFFYQLVFHEFLPWFRRNSLSGRVLAATRLLYTKSGRLVTLRGKKGRYFSAGMEYIGIGTNFWPFDPVHHSMSETGSHIPNLTELPLEALLPQRRPMLLLDRVLRGDALSAVTESVVQPTWPLAGEAGVEALLLIEIAAQTAGVCCSWQRIRAKGLDSTQTGWIVAIKKSRLVASVLPFGTRIRAEARKTINYGGFQEVAAILFAGGARVAEVLLQLYQPQEAG